MANHIEIPLDLWEAFTRMKMPGEVRQVVDFIVRKTYGWHKQTDAIPLSQFCLATGMKKSSIIRAIHKAENHGIVYRLVNGHYGLHRDFTSWKPFTRKRIVYQDVNIVYQDVNKSFTKKRPSIDTTKDTSSKDIISPPQKPKATDPRVKILTEYLFKKWAAYVSVTWEIAEKQIAWGRWGKFFKEQLKVIHYDDLVEMIDYFYAYDGKNFTLKNCERTPERLWRHWKLLFGEWNFDKKPETVEEYKMRKEIKCQENQQAAI